MRPARAEDQDTVRELVEVRSQWLERRGLPGWRDSARQLAERCGTHQGTVWLLERAGQVIGHTTVRRDFGPPWGWTPEELAEPALYLSDTVTHPAHRDAEPGSLMSLWAVDRAAREGRAWVRRDCTSTAVVAHWAARGFAVVHDVPGPPRRVFTLARRAERQAWLRDVLRVEAPAPAADRPAPVHEAALAGVRPPARARCPGADR